MSDNDDTIIIEPAGGDDTTLVTPSVPAGTSKDLVLYNSNRALDMTIFEREIGRILNKMRATGRRDEDTEPSILRAIETYEAAQR